MIDADKPISISLKAGALSVVMMALYKLPYEHAAPIVDELRRQIAEAEPQAFEIAATTRVNGQDIVRE